METIFTTKLTAFCDLLEQQQLHRLREQHLDCQANIDNCKVKTKPGRKFVNVDVGTCGKYMVEISTGNIFGIKGYGQVHRGHFYGTLDTINEYFWGEYYPHRHDGKLSRQKANSCPVITHAPEVPSFQTEGPDINLAAPNQHGFILRPSPEQRASAPVGWESV